MKHKNGFVGCYWCKNRNGFKCSRFKFVDLTLTLKELKRPIEEKSLIPLMKEEEIDMWECIDTFIGEDCRSFNNKKVFMFR